MLIWMLWTFLSIFCICVYDESNIASPHWLWPLAVHIVVTPCIFFVVPRHERGEFLFAVVLLVGLPVLMALSSSMHKSGIQWERERADRSEWLYVETEAWVEDQNFDFRCRQQGGVR